MAERHLAKLGSGERFEHLEHSFGKGIKNPAALAATIGRRKYGKKKFESIAEKGKERHEKKERHLTA